MAKLNGTILCRLEMMIWIFAFDNTVMTHRLQHIAFQLGVTAMEINLFELLVYAHTSTSIELDPMVCGEYKQMRSISNIC